MSVARVWALPGPGGMGGLRAEFAAGTETPHPSHRKKQALPAVHPNSKPWLRSAGHLRARSTARQLGTDINAQFVTTRGILHLWTRLESRPASSNRHELKAVTGSLQSMTLSSR